MQSHGERYTPRNFKRIALAVLFFWSLMSVAQKPKSEGKSAEWIVHHTADFSISGDTLTSAWQSTAWMTLPQRDTPSQKKTTRAKLLYSDTGLYGLFWCEDSKITATLKEDFADLYNEDVVEAFFWTDEEHPLYFEYELSPLNYELAILVPNMKGTFFGWRPWHYEGDRLTKHAARIIYEGENVRGWVAEFFIPYSLLKPLQKVPPKKGMRWRANVYRIDYDQGRVVLAAGKNKFS
ncbi:MAG: carbohydrate-binding family 9-like protein [Cyclobacteriaceae bacterium]|nr:carbohydrate-binding family 9-like protein [Cyclobacteriaceae bacterium]